MSKTDSTPLTFEETIRTCIKRAYTRPPTAGTDEYIRMLNDLKKSEAFTPQDEPEVCRNLLIMIESIEKWGHAFEYVDDKSVDTRIYTKWQDIVDMFDIKHRYDYVREFELIRITSEKGSLCGAINKYVDLVCTSDDDRPEIKARLHQAILDEHITAWDEDHTNFEIYILHRVMMIWASLPDYDFTYHRALATIYQTCLRAVRCLEVTPETHVPTTTGA